jgi:hypothetical protein
MLVISKSTPEFLNSKWEKFKSLIPQLCPVVVDKEAKLSYRNTKGIRKKIDLYFERLVRE